MSSQQRETGILQLLEEKEFLSTEEAMGIFNASPATIRRDFTRLAENHSARRVKGGLRRLPHDANNSIPFCMREQWNTGEKSRIAERAREFLPDNAPVFIHGGSTTAHLAKFLSGGTVITNSIAIPMLLMERFPSGGGPEVILPGGTIDLKAGILFGSKTEAALNSYYAKTAFFSARGMDEEGVLDTNDQLAAVARAMIRHADRVVMLADPSKFRKFGMSRLVLWPEVDILITVDTPENRPLLDAVRKQGVAVVFA